eukprot:1916520-Ditylum_brightwellii.AAC.1
MELGLVKNMVMLITKGAISLHQGGASYVGGKDLTLWWIGGFAIWCTWWLLGSSGFIWVMLFTGTIARGGDV